MRDLCILPFLFELSIQDLWELIIKFASLVSINVKITFFNILRRDINKERAKSKRLSSLFVLPLKGNFCDIS